jgi:alcohol dehydrogenase (cytochrome c)
MSMRKAFRGLATCLALLASTESHALDATSSSAGVSVQWPSYNNGYKGQRFSTLAQINARNVASIQEVCRIKLADGGAFQTGPVVVDGTMYVTTSQDTFALDPTNCAVRWKFSYEPEQTQPYPGNRGVAVMNGRVFRGTGDGRLLALDAKTGALIWKNVVSDPTLNEFLIGVPLAWNGVVYVGTTGSDFGIKGRIAAYDALTGREVWRFVTIPTGKEPGADTWENRQAAETGGGGTWSTFTLDVIEGELFIPVGNPAPSFAPQYRPGANLFTNSVLVLDARTGALKWWYQLVANDGHDLDLAAAPVLYTNSDGRDVVAAAGKDGYVHAVDRETHKVLFKTAVTTIENEGVRPSEKEIRFCPGGAGGVEWNGPAFAPATRTLYVGSVDWCTLVKAAPQKFVKAEGVMLWGATARMDPGYPAHGWLHALDSDNGHVRWKYQADAPIIAGVTATAGGIVVTGDTAGHFIALDGSDGRVLLKKDTGGAIAGGVVTYSIASRQYIALTSGNVSRSVFGALGAPTIVIMSLDPKMLSAGADADVAGGGNDVARGRALYAENCVACHGSSGDGGTGKRLKGLASRQSFDETVRAIQDPKPPMPKLYPSPLGEQAVRDIAAFIRTFSN